MTAQPLLDGVPGISVNVTVTHPAERKRLSRQCAAILDRLRQGEATNGELVKIALRYSARIEECRKAGYVIVIDRRDHVTGLNVYRLEAEP